MTAEQKNLGKQEVLQNAPGLLVVFTGRSGAGKDKVLGDVRAHPDLAQYSLGFVVTCATRAPREGEIDGVHYHFISEQRLFEMHDNGELVEPPVPYRNSHKATSADELFKVFDGKNVVWRVESDLAGQIAEGSFFERLGEKGKALRERSVVIFVDCDSETIERRRKQREGNLYDKEKYQKGDEHDNEAWEAYGSHFEHVIQNPDGENDAVEQVVEILLGHLAQK